MTTASSKNKASGETKRKRPLKTKALQKTYGSPDPVRFQRAIDSIVTLEERERHGIGMQKEKTVHAILKNYFDPDPDHQEIPLEGYIADIFDGHQVIEIQTAGFGSMRSKLEAFLPKYPVTIVYPIPHIKYITWVDPETGELLENNKSHFTGSFYESFREIYRISSYLKDPNLTIRPVLVDLTEYRIRDGYSRDKKRGSHRFDRIPTLLYDELLLHDAADYGRLIPESLPEPFTAKELQESVGIHRKSISFSQVLQIMTAVGAVERTGLTNRRAYLYERALRT